MTIEAKYKKASTELTDFLLKTKSSCESKYAEIDQYALVLPYKLEQAEKELNRQFRSIRPKALQKKAKKMSAKWRKTASMKTKGDFDKFVYYIDMINSKKTPGYVIRKNPRYCDTVLSVVVNEYNILYDDIVKTRKNPNSLIHSKKERFLYPKKKQVMSEMGRFYDTLNELAEQETDSVIQNLFGKTFNESI